MTAKITSAQEKQFKRFVEDIADHALKEIGPDRDGLQRLLEKGGEFQNYLSPHVAAGIRRFTGKSPNYCLARTILGKDFISPEEIAKARSVAYSDKQLARYADKLPSQEILEWCRDSGFALMATPPRKMSTLDVRSLKASLYYSKEGGWYSVKNERFSRDDTTGDDWLMVKKEPVFNSTSRNWDEQKKSLSDVEHVPNAAEMCWFITTFFEVRGVRLFEGLYVRTSSLNADGCHVLVGDVGGGGFFVGYDLDDLRASDVGLASARK